MTAHLRIASVSRKPSRARLLAGSAICGAAALLANPAAALDPNTLPDVTGVMTAAGALGSGGLGSATAPIVNAPVATILTVDIDAARSIIDWKSFSVGSAAEVDFNGMKAGDIAVNRSPLQMVIEGTVNGGPGSLWFLSPGGVLVQGGGKIAAASVLMSNGDLNDAAFLGSASLSAALATIDANAALIRMDGIASAVTAKLTAAGDVELTSTADLAVTQAVGGAVTLTAMTGAVTAADLKATAGDLAVTGAAIELANGGAAAKAKAVAGKVTLDGPLTLTDDAQVTAAGAVAFTGAIDGPGALSVDTPAQVAMAQDVGTTKALGALTLTGGGSLTFDGEAITATNDITLQAATLTKPDVTLTSTAGAVVLGGAVGAKAITFAAPVKVSADTTLTAAGAVKFNDTVDGPAGLTLSTPQQITLAKDVGATTALKALALTGVGPLVFDGATITTADDLTIQAATLTAPAATLASTGGSIRLGGDIGAQAVTFDAPVKVTADTKLTATEAVKFNQTVDGPGALTLATAKQINLAKDVGATTALKSLTLTGGGPLVFDGAAITTTDDLTIQAATLTKADVTLASTAGAIVLGGNVGAAAVTFAAPVTVSADTTLTATGAVKFNQTLDGPAALTLATPQQITLAKDVGGTTALKSLAFTGGGPLVFDGAAITTTDDLSLQRASLTADAVTLTSTSGSVRLGGDLAAAKAVTFAAPVVVAGASKVSGGSAVFDKSVEGHSLVVDVTGAAQFKGALGGGAVLDQLGVRADSVSFAASGNHLGALAAQISAGGLTLATTGDLTIGAVGGIDGVKIDAGDLAISVGGDLRLSRDIATATTADTTLVVGSLSVDTGAAVRTRALDVTLGSETDLQLLATTNAFATLKVTAAAPSGAVHTVKVVDSTALTITSGLKATGDVSLETLTGDLTTGAVDAAGGVALTASQGQLSVASAKAGGDYFAKAKTFAGSALAPDAGRDVTVVSTDDAADFLVPTLTAKRHLTVTSANKGVTTSGLLVAQTGDVTLNAATDLKLGADVRADGPIQAVSLNAGGAVSQDAGKVVAHTVTGGAGGAFTLGAHDNAFDAIGALSVGGDVTLFDSLALALASPLDFSGGSVSVTAQALTFGALTAGKGLRLKTTGGGLRGVSATAKAGDVTLDAAQDVVIQHAVTPGAGAAQLTAKGGDVLISGQLVQVDGPIHADDGQVKATATDGALILGDVTAGKDIALSDTSLNTAAAGDGGSITAGSLNAGADVALYSADGGVKVASVSAGDDIAIRALYGKVESSGALMSGRGGTDGATSGADIGAADRLSTDHNFPDFLPSTTFILAGHDVDVHAQAIQVGGGIVAGMSTASVGSPDQTPSDVRLGSTLQSNPTLGLAAGVSVADITANRDVQIDSAGGVSTARLLAGQDVALLARGAGVATDAVTAGRHVVIYSMAGPVHVGGAIQAGHKTAGFDPQTGADTPDGAGERLAQYINYLDLDDTSRPYITGPGDLMIKTAAGDVSVAGAVTSAGSVRVQSSGGIALDQSTTAVGGDIRLDAGKAGAGLAVATGGLSAGGDVAVWARTGAAALGDLGAGDDVVVRAGGSIGAGSLTSGRGDPALADAGSGGDRLITAAGAIAIESVSYDLTGGDIDLKAGGAIEIKVAAASAVTGLQALGADSDIRLQAAGSVTITPDPVDSTVVIEAHAGRDLLIDSGADITVGALFADQRDIGLRGAGAISARGAKAGDDVVMRSATGAITVNGDLSSGQAADSTAADQAGDLLAGAGKITLAAVSYDLVGGDIDLKAPGAVHVSGAATAAGDASDVRLQTTTAGDIRLGSGSAGRDILLDSAADAATGDLDAGRDVGVRASAIATTSLTAGDDIALRATDAITVDGALKSGLGADSAATDQAGDLIAGSTQITVEGKTFDLKGGDIDLKAPGAVHVSGAATAAGDDSDVRLQTTTAGDIRLGSGSAGRDILLDAKIDVGAGALTAGRDIGARADGGALTTASLKAGDDVALRASGAISVNGALAAGAAPAAASDDQAADLLAGKDPVALGVRKYDLLQGGDIDLKAGGAIALTAPAAGADKAVAATGAGADIRLQAAGPITLAANSGFEGASAPATASAGGDVLIDSGAKVEAGIVSAGRDLAVRAGGATGAVTLGEAKAGDDVALRAAGAIKVSGAVTAGADGAADAVGAADDLLALGGLKMTVGSQSFGLAGHDADLRGTGVAVDGQVKAGSDVRLQAGAGGVGLGSGAAGGDVLLDASGDIASGGLEAGGDVGARAGGGISLASASARDDVVLRAGGGVDAGALNAGGAEVDGAGDLIGGPAKIDLGGGFGFGGSNVDVKAGGGVVTAGGAAGGDYRVQAASVTVGDVNAGGDVLLDGAGVGAGALTAGGDVALYARSGQASLRSASAGDDVVVRASGGLSAGALTTTGLGSGVAGDRLAGAAGAFALAGQSFSLDGADVDLRAATVALSADAAAARDLRIHADGAATFAGASAGRDLLVDAGGDVAGGALSAGRDLAVNSTGGGVTLAQLSAGDDAVLRAARQVSITGAASAQGGGDESGAADVLFNADRTSLAGDFALAGANLDVRSGGSIRLGGAASASADVRLQTTGADAGVQAGPVSAGTHILLDGAGSQAVTAGDLVATSGDVAVRGRSGGAVALAGATAGDDIVVRTTGAVGASGGLKTNGAADTAGAGDRLVTAEGAMSVGGVAFDLTTSAVDLRGGDVTLAGAVASQGDVHLQATGKLTTGDLAAKGDVVADAAGAATLGGVTAGRDLVVRSAASGVTLRDASAGDDLVLRAATDLKVSGGLASGSAPTASAGAADRLATVNGPIRWADDLAEAPKAFGLTGGDLDLKAGSSITVGGALKAASSDARFETKALSLASVDAGKLLFVRAESFGGAGDLKAPRVRIEGTRAGGLALGSAASGDAASNLGQGAFDRIIADRVQLTAGSTAGALRGDGVTVGALSLDVDRIKSSLEIYAGSAATVRVSGKFAPNRTATLGVQIGLPSAANGDWTPASIRIVSDTGGSIGFSTTRDGHAFLGAAAFGPVELNAVDSILAGSQAYIDKLAVAQPAEVAALVRTFSPQQAADGSSMVLLTTGSLTLRAGRVATQDTSPAFALTRTGIYVNGALQLGRTQAGAATQELPQYVELYGALNNGSTLLTNENAALSNQLVLIDGVRPAQFYRLNTCVILQQASCTARGGAPQLGAPDRITRLQLLDRQDSGVSEDPTVASATNEEIWRDPE